MTGNLFLKMLESQEKLNQMINPNWKEERSWVEFKTAFIVEYGEFIESYDWKWWKAGETNRENMKIEMADMYHFILSGILLSFNIPQVEKSIQLVNFEEIDKSINLNATKSKKEFISYNDQVFSSILSLYEKIFSQNKQFYLPVLIQYLYCFPVINGINFQELYKIYIAKNSLNMFRQMNGYKENRYRKIINGKEDNVYVMDFLKSYADDLSLLPEKIIQYMEKIAKSVEK